MEKQMEMCGITPLSIRIRVSSHQVDIYFLSVFHSNTIHRADVPR